MGRRRRRQINKKNIKRIPDVFNCPNCGMTAIKIEIDRSTGISHVRCGQCDVGTVINEVNSLTEAVDVYGSFTDWYYSNREK